MCIRDSLLRFNKSKVLENLFKLFETMVIVENKIILLPGNKNKVIWIIKYKYLQQEKNFQFSKFKYIFIKQWVLH